MSFKVLIDSAITIKRNSICIKTLSSNNAIARNLSSKYNDDINTDSSSPLQSLDQAPCAAIVDKELPTADVYEVEARNLDNRFFDYEQVRVTFAKFGAIEGIGVRPDDEDASLLVATVCFKSKADAEDSCAGLNDKRFDRKKISVRCL